MFKKYRSFNPRPILKLSWIIVSAAARRCVITLSFTNDIQSHRSSWNLPDFPSYPGESVLTCNRASWITLDFRGGKPSLRPSSYAVFPGSRCRPTRYCCLRIAQRISDTFLKCKTFRLRVRREQKGSWRESQLQAWRFRPLLQARGLLYETFRRVLRLDVPSSFSPPTLRQSSSSLLSFVCDARRSQIRHCSLHCTCN